LAARDKLAAPRDAASWLESCSARDQELIYAASTAVFAADMAAIRADARLAAMDEAPVE